LWVHSSGPRTLELGNSGDVDGDGDVDFADLLWLLAHWGQTGAPRGRADLAARGDIDASGAVDFIDLMAVLEQFGRRPENTGAPTRGQPGCWLWGTCGCNCMFECPDFGCGCETGDCWGGGPPDPCIDACAAGCANAGKCGCLPQGTPDCNPACPWCFPCTASNCDSDGDGTPDPYDCDIAPPVACGMPEGACDDDDNDGIKNINDTDSPLFDPFHPESDLDGDGVLNRDDPDFRFREPPEGSAPSDSADCNGDGVPDVNDPFHPDYNKRHPGSDPDHDGIPNEADPDDDDDDIPDDEDPDPQDPEDPAGGGCTVRLSGPTSVREGDTVTIQAMPLMRLPVAAYEWAIVQGSSLASIIGSHNSGTISIAANSAGWVLVRVWAYEEDDPEDERQPCAASATHASEIKACPCGSFMIAGPDYVGVHAPIDLALVATPRWQNCPFPNAVWEVITGEALLEPGATGSGYTYSRTAAAAVGAVTFQATYTQGLLPCVVQKTVQVVQYEPVTIRYATFIPCEIVETPLNWLDPLGSVPDYFGGDNRIDAVAGTSLFSAAHLRYRTCHQVTIRVSDHFVNPPQNLNSQVPPFGVTTAFDAANVAAVPGTPCGWQQTGNPYNSTTHPQTPSSYRIEFGRVAHNIVRVDCFLSARDPLVPFDLACALEAEFDFLLTQTIDPLTGRQVSEVRVHGSHDFYPSHELYISPDGMFPALAPRYTFDAYPFGVVTDLCNVNPMNQQHVGPFVVPLVH